MLIYVKGTATTDSQLRTLSDELYSYRHADIGLANFHYAFTPYTRFYEQHYYRIRFEIPGAEKQKAFLKMIEADFDVIRVDPTEGGEETENEALEWWRQSHTDNPLPRKIARRPVVFKIKVVQGPYGLKPAEDVGLMGGQYYYSRNNKECLFIAREYTPEAYKQAKAKCREVSSENYDEIYMNYEGAPAVLDE